MWKKFKNWTTNNFDIVKFEPEIVRLGTQIFTLRKATSLDINQFLFIEKENYQGKTPWDYSAFIRELNRRQFSLYLSLVQGNQIIAFIGFNWNSREAHITNFAISRTKQHQGIGKWLLQYVINYAKKIPVFRITLEVSVDNEIAIKLYHSLSFKDGRIKKFYYSFNHGDAMNMYLDLEQS
ncbi:MAG: ribosomal protein S18-alanine N-acetyltransferase [Lactobacillaceae bacterium]